MSNSEVYMQPDTSPFPHKAEDRRRLIDAEFADWFLRGAQGGEEDISQIRLLLTREARQIVPQPDNRFDIWIDWVHRYTDAQATFTHVTPRAVRAIQDDTIAAEYCWRMLSNDSLLDEWRPLPEAVDEQAEMLNWWARFDSTPVGEYIDFLLRSDGKGDWLDEC